MISLRVSAALFAFLESSVLLGTVLADLNSSYDCNATLSGTRLCVVNYKSSLILHCPNSLLTYGEWWRKNPVTGELNGVCHNPVCNILEPLTNQDSGLYFCQRDNKTYPVNVTILAPPSIECDPHLCSCNDQTNTCLIPMIEISYDTDIKLTTRFKGEGPLSVVWKHKGKEINCNDGTTADGHKCSIVHGHTNDSEFETLTLSAPQNVDRDSGFYAANISNPFGYNMTEQYVDLYCSPQEPPVREVNRSVSLSKGETRNVTLSTQGDRINYLWICFTTNSSVNMENINLTSLCVRCPNRMIGNCSGLPNRPHWVVFRNETGRCPGNSLLQLTVFVKDFNKTDVGRLMLSWSNDDIDSSPKNHKVLTVTSLNYKPTSSMDRFIYSGIGGGGLCLIIIVVVVSIVTGVVVYKRKKRAINRARRRAERRLEAQNREERQHGRRGAAISDDEEQLIDGVGGGMRNYGSTNNNTSSDPENNVYLPTDNDGDNVRPI